MAVAGVAAVGWRVRVFWEGDDAWFEGVVTKYAPASGYFVEYDDGEQQWEAEDPALVQFLYQAETGATENEDDAAQDDTEDQEEPPREERWSAQPPPTADDDQDDADAYEEDEYEEDHDHGEEQHANAQSSTTASPLSEEEEEDEEHEHIAPASEMKPPPARVPATRDAAKYVKSGVFFRDPETLRETKTALLKEVRELQTQYELLAGQLAQKEQLSQSLKRDLHGLKAQVTVASLRAPTSGSSSKTNPRTAKDWTELVLTQKTANRTTRQLLSGLHTQLTEEQATIQRMEKQKQQLEARLARVPRRDLCSLVDVQMEITQVMAEKRDLEAQLAKVLAVDTRGKSKGTSSTSMPTGSSRVSSTTSENQRDVKTELEKELRVLEKTLLRVGDQVEEWKLSYEKENARIVPIRTRIASLQNELHKYESSQVLLRSVFLRLDRSGSGCIPSETALEAMMLLAPRDADAGSIDAMGKQGMPASLDFAAFTACFRQVFSQK